MAKVKNVTLYLRPNQVETFKAIGGSPGIRYLLDQLESNPERLEKFKKQAIIAIGHEKVLSDSLRADAFKKKVR